MTRQGIYGQIVQLTSELHATNVAEKIFNTAKEGDSKKVEEVFETFKKENHDLYVKIERFGLKISTKTLNGEKIYVFGSKKDKKKGSYVFDANTINSVDLCALMLLGGIDDYYLFDWGTESSERFVEALSNAGYDKLAYYVDNFSVYDYIGTGKKYQNIYECLVDVFENEYEW